MAIMITCNQCGERCEAAQATQHWCKTRVTVEHMFELAKGLRKNYDDIAVLLDEIFKFDSKPR